MSSFIVGHRVFKKKPEELLIGSSVVAGNTDSVRERETKAKGENFSSPVYKIIDHLELVEVYKGFTVQSNVAPEVVYEILYDALEGEVKGVLVGVKEEGNYTYYSLVSRETKSVKKQISFLIEFVDFGLIPAVQKEVEEILTLSEEEIREKFGNPPEKIYAGSFVGSTDKGLILIPFSTYKPKEVIPAYTGEEDERIPMLESELEELNRKLAELKPESEEFKNLSERRREILAQLTKLRNRLYNPDILKAVKVKGDRLFITQKPEIRYLGENLLSAAYEYKALKAVGVERVKGVYAVLTLPVYNNLSGQLQRSYLEVMLSLFDGNELYPLELQKARNTLQVMDEAVGELLRSAEAGTKPNLTAVKEKIAENLSLKRRIEDLEKFVLSRLSDENREELIAFLREVKSEIELGRRILFSPFTVSRLVNVYEILSLLQEAGLDTSDFTKEDWNELFSAVETLNETLENFLKGELKEELKLLVKFFLGRLEEGKPIRYTFRVGDKVVETAYPREGKLTVLELYPNRAVNSIVKTALVKLNASEKLKRLEEIEFLFKGVTVRIAPVVVNAITRKVFNLVAKALLKRADYDRETEVQNLVRTLVSSWLGEVPRGGEERGKEEGEVLDIEGFEELLS